jgi:hypothetical protein
MSGTEMDDVYVGRMRARIFSGEDGNRLAGIISQDWINGLVSEEMALALTGEIEAFQAARRAMAPDMGGIVANLPPRILIEPKSARILPDVLVRSRRKRGLQRVKAKYAKIPAVLCEGFTQAMQSVLGQLVWLTDHGTAICDRNVEFIAKRSKVSVRLVQTTLAAAKRFGLIGIRYRRRMTSLITITSDRWLSYLKPKTSLPENEILLSSLELNDPSQGEDRCGSSTIPPEPDPVPVHTSPKPKNLPPGAASDWWTNPARLALVPGLFKSRWETGENPALPFAALPSKAVAAPAAILKATRDPAFEAAMLKSTKIVDEASAERKSTAETLAQVREWFGQRADAAKAFRAAFGTILTLTPEEFPRVLGKHNPFARINADSVLSAVVKDWLVSQFGDLVDGGWNVNVHGSGTYLGFERESMAFEFVMRWKGPATPIAPGFR